MKRVSLTSVYTYGLLFVLFMMVLHAPLAIYFGHLFPEIAAPIKAWKEIVLLLLSILAIVIVTRRKLWRSLLASWPIRLSLVYIVLHCLLAVLMPTTLIESVAGLMIDLRFIVFFILLYVAAALDARFIRRTLKTVAAGAMVVLGFGLLQITVLPDDILKGLGYSQETIRPYTTIDRNPDFVRINSTLRGPNPLGALLIVYLSLIAAYLIRRASKLSSKQKVISGLAVAAGVAVLFASFSRSAYLAALLSIVIVLVATVRRRPSRKLTIGLVGAAIVTLVLGILVQSSDWYSNVVLHEDPESTIVSKSNSEHLASLANGTDRLLRQPLGAGIGSTGSAALYDEAGDAQIIENYYLFVAHESGWLGLALFIGLNYVVLRDLWRRRTEWPALGLFASGIGLAIIGLLLPVWTDETVALTWWGLVGAILGGGYATRTRQ